jgi:hypothetical protein
MKLLVENHRIYKDAPYNVPVQLVDITPEEIVEINEGREYLRVFGRIRYTNGLFMKNHNTFVFMYLPGSSGGTWLAAPVRDLDEILDKPPINLPPLKKE